MKLRIVLLVGLASTLANCAAVESVSRTTKSVLGMRDTEPVQAMPFGGVRNEYHAALERRKQDAIMEILGEGGAQ